MVKVRASTGSKPQERTRETTNKILDAAESLFSEQGFENTQLDQVAARAGCSRGAIYAHYVSKEEVFLALMEHSVRAKFAAVCKKIADEPDLSERRSIFKLWIAGQISDTSWSALNLEYKLYAVRRPDVREKLFQLYQLIFVGSTGSLAELLFGKGMTKAVRANLEQRLAAMGGALNGLVLENQFRAGQIPTNQLKRLVEEIFDALIHI